MARSENPKGMLKAVKDTATQTDTATDTATETATDTATETPVENLLELDPSVLQYLQGYVNQVETEIQAQKQSPEYQSALAQQKAALDRFTAIRSSLSGAENDTLKANATVASMDEKLNIAASTASKFQQGMFRGILAASGYELDRLGMVNLQPSSEGKMYIKFSLKD